MNNSLQPTRFITITIDRTFHLIRNFTRNLIWNARGIADIADIARRWPQSGCRPSKLPWQKFRYSKKNSYFANNSKLWSIFFQIHWNWQNIYYAVFKWYSGLAGISSILSHLIKICICSGHRNQVHTETCHKKTRHCHDGFLEIQLREIPTW